MERKPFPSETQERFIVRLPDGMRDRIAEAAIANNRSMNAEIVLRLEKSFQDKPLSVDDAVEKLNEATARLRDLFAHVLVHDNDDVASGVVITGAVDPQSFETNPAAPKKRVARRRVD